MRMSVVRCYGIMTKRSLYIILIVAETINTTVGFINKRREKNRYRHCSY